MWSAIDCDFQLYTYFLNSNLLNTQYFHCRENSNQPAYVLTETTLWKQRPWETSFWDLKRWFSLGYVLKRLIAFVGVLLEFNELVILKVEYLRNGAYCILWIGVSYVKFSAEHIGDIRFKKKMGCFEINEVLVFKRKSINIDNTVYKIWWCHSIVNLITFKNSSYGLWDMMFFQNMENDFLSKNTKSEGPAIGGGLSD